MNMTILVGNYRWGDREETLSLADALDRGNVYKGGLHTCRHCFAYETETWGKVNRATRLAWRKHWFK